MFCSEKSFVRIARCIKISGCTIRHTRFIVMLFLLRTRPRLELFEEIIPLVVDQDEGREIFHADFPDRFHTQFWVFYAFDRLDAALRQNGSYASDGSEIESAVFLASFGNYVGTVAFGYHDERSAVLLELVHVGIHAVGCRWSH